MKRLWNNKLIVKLLLSYLVLIILLSASFYFYSTAELRNFYIASLGERMRRDSQLLDDLLPLDQQGASFDARCRQLGDGLAWRITVIAADGKVLCDSAEASAEMENHANRPEVAEALRRGSGSATRFSTTVQLEMIYHAHTQSGAAQGRVIRVAKPLTEIDIAIRANRASVLNGLLVAAALGLLLAWLFSRQLTRRFQRLEQFAAQVARGSFPENFFPHRSRDEISLLEQRLNDMSEKIRDNLQQVVTEKEKLDSILRCMIEGVLVLDPKGQVLLINDQARIMFRVAEGRDIYGVSMLEISRHPEVHKILDDVLVFDFSEQRYSRDVELDEDRWFRVNAGRLRNQQGDPLGSILVFHDITGIKRFESIRSDFVANVSHELRTPLTAIRGYVETLLDTPPSEPEDSRQFLQIIDRHAERLSRLTEDLLTLSDLESGNIQLNIQPLDADQLMQRVLEVFWDRAAKKSIKLGHHAAADLPKLLGDTDRLQQLFINLVDNAIKYTPDGREVTLTAARVTRNNGALPFMEISVADTGPGIPERDLPRLTERFYRVDRARSRDLGGTGLGLAIVKHIVQAHKGELRIDSTINKGTTVRVRLPVAPSNGLTGKAILFLCTGNSCRSQMAEAFARHYANGAAEIFSAGTEPKPLHPLAILVMKEAGVDISNQRSKGLDAVPLEKIDHVITLCGSAQEQCPALPLRAQRSHWPITDPAEAEGDDEQVLAVFRRVRDEIRSRVESWLASERR
jgi:two-component system phosphate regulon sensor histidine kinase PhoR